MIIDNGWKPLTIITKHSILDVATALDPPLISIRYNMSECVMLIALAKIEAGKRCDFSCLCISLSAPPHHPSLIHRWFKHCPKIKINKAMHSALPHPCSTESSQYQYWKASKYSILTVFELGSTSVEVLNWVSKFYAPLILNTNFIKGESKIGYPQDSISHS